MEKLPGFVQFLSRHIALDVRFDVAGVVVHRLVLNPAGPGWVDVQACLWQDGRYAVVECTRFCRVPCTCQNRDNERDKPIPVVENPSLPSTATMSFMVGMQ